MIKNEIQSVDDYFQAMQTKICASLEEIDGKGLFHKDPWERSDGGGGTTCVMREGNIFEQAAVGYSNIQGKQMPPSATIKRPELAGKSFMAIGISLVLHPKNPYVPTTHANLRFFSAADSEAKPIWWFGGGFDLTPFYPFHEDVVHWHQKAKEACDPFGEHLYPKYKKWCDEYFFLKHREETRGVGGLFFDDLNEYGFSKTFNFVKAVGDQFLPAYLPIVEARCNHEFSERERQFQLYRRGRYVEFNLIHARGTLFGLQSGGRVESILMSLPPKVRWEYNWKPQPGSPEAELYKNYLEPRDWLTEA